MHVRPLVLAFTAVAFLALGFQSTVSASVIGTQTYLSSETRTEQVARLNAALSRADVQSQLVALGVDPANALAWVQALSDTELAEVGGELAALPAGGDGLFAVLGLVFLVLLILELTGVVDIFKKF